MGGYSGAVGGAGVEACGVDVFCIQKGGIGALGSPVAQTICDGTGCHVGSCVNSTYQTGGNYNVKTPAPKGEITINCSVASETSADCSLASYTSFLVINDGSHQINPTYPGLRPGDVPAGSMARMFQENQKLFNSANDWGTATFLGTGAVLVAGPVAGELAISPLGDLFFSRGGWANSNDYIRIGWAWYRYSIVDSAYGGFTYFGVRILKWHVWGP